MFVSYQSKAETIPLTTLLRSPPLSPHPLLSQCSVATMATTSKVEAELQAYVTEKDLNRIFVACIEQMLMDKPTNPYQVRVRRCSVRRPSQLACESSALWLRAALSLDGCERSRPPRV